MTVERDEAPRYIEAIDTMFGFIKDGSDAWDGVTNPIRTIDWSTSSPVVKAVK